MSRIQTQAAEIEWRRMADMDTYYPLRDGPRLQPARWVINEIRDRITDTEFDAASAMMKWQECASEGKSLVAGERVEGGDSDPHAREWDRAVCLAKVTAAWGSVAASRGVTLVRLRVLRAALSFPHRTFEDLRRVAGGDTRAPSARTFDQLSWGLGALDSHFETMDAGYGIRRA